MKESHHLFLTSTNIIFNEIISEWTHVYKQQDINIKINLRLESTQDQELNKFITCTEQRYGVLK